MARYELLMPKLGESIIEATILNWTKEVGDWVEEEEAVVEIATDKVDSEVPSPVQGKLVEKVYQDGDVVPVGSVIAVLETVAEGIEGEEPTSSPHENEVLEEIAESSFGQQVPFVPMPMEPLQPVVETATEVSQEARFYSPLVLNIARKEGISSRELDQLSGSGRGGRVTKRDILNYVKAKAANGEGVHAENGATTQTQIEESLLVPPVEEIPANLLGTKDILTRELPTYKTEEVPIPEVQADVVSPMPKAPEAAPAKDVKPKKEKPAVPEILSARDDAAEIIQMDRVRKMIAKNMTNSLQVSAHVTSFVEADVTEIVQWRNSIKKDFQHKYHEKLTFTPIFVQAVVQALREHPMVNSSVEGEQIIVKKDINIGVAVALPNDNLIVPVIRHADRLNLVGLTAAVNDLAARARENKLKPDELQGGTYTVSNVGTFGNVMGTPIIMQPQAAIMALGAIRKLPAVIETESGDAIAIRQKMFLSHSYDHRIIDGALGGRFVKRVADILEAWDTSQNI
ncbi:MAG: dihydrolipoamide acetyltransferase family protein [Bacteroidota bacterium]